MFKKHSTALLIALLVFIFVRLIMGITGEKSDKMTISIKATVLQNDIFQLFYLLNGDQSFTEQHSVIAKVIGNDEPQNIEFIVPLDTAINQLRIDIGSNRNQMPMRISGVYLKARNQSYSYDISESFIRNVYIKEEGGKFVTKTISNSYDPFFISRFNLATVVANLAKDHPLVDTTVALILALIFGIATFLSFVLSAAKNTHAKFQTYIAVFAFIISTPPIIKLIGYEPETASKEKRDLSPQPEWAFNEEFPREYEAYYNDNFGLRPTIINWASKLKTGLFRDSPQPELVQFGKKDFLFFNEYNALDGGIYSSYSKTNLATSEQLEYASQKQLRLKKDLGERGIRYVVGFWPNKHSIYSELLPFTMKMQVQGKTSLADQTVSYFAKRGMPLFDVRKDLLDIKNEKQLYFKLDSHWNSNGAFEAYHAFCEQTFDELGLIPFPLTDFEISYSKTRDGDLTNLLGIDSISGYYDKKPNYKFKNSKGYRFINPGGIYQNTFVTENKNCGNDKVALVFRDSYGAALVQFLSLHYSKVVYVAKSPVDMYWVNNVKPDVVILGVVERRLPYIIDTVGESVDSLP